MQNIFPGFILKYGFPPRKSAWIMKHQTLIESDGKTVFITAGSDARTSGRWLWPVLSMLLLLALFAFIFWQILTELRMGLVLWFLFFRFGGYPALRRMSRKLVFEEVELNTASIISRRSYGFIRGKKREQAYNNSGLATGGDALNKAGTQLQVSWFSEDPHTRKTQLLYRHFFPMAADDYEKAKEYVQELFDLEDEGDHFELLFSAN